ncbi:wd-40 repeat protein [Stylonychia lemnae]|uniref:Wd-40 repeat protein n=1 Tax=Stylonychia lemnae TaxID=5949 RepID=A0A078B3B9_STYLE|nr:wd-40 repeat protein [Stylonychia lemnae]|eukprot:CDW88934.1 wd-40 repeat protein [Stylonychia lemnae]
MSTQQESQNQIPVQPQLLSSSSQAKVAALDSLSLKQQIDAYEQMKTIATLTPQKIELDGFADYKVCNHYLNTNKTQLILYLYKHSDNSRILKRLDFLLMKETGHFDLQDQYAIEGVSEDGSYVLLEFKKDNKWNHFGVYTVYQLFLREKAKPLFTLVYNNSNLLIKNGHVKLNFFGFKLCLFNSYKFIKIINLDLKEVSNQLNFDRQNGGMIFPRKEFNPPKLLDIEQFLKSDALTFKGYTFMKTYKLEEVTPANYVPSKSSCIKTFNYCSQKQFLFFEQDYEETKTLSFMRDSTLQDIKVFDFSPGKPLTQLFSYKLTEGGGLYKFIAEEHEQAFIVVNCNTNKAENKRSYQLLALDIRNKSGSLVADQFNFIGFSKNNLVFYDDRESKQNLEKLPFFQKREQFQVHCLHRKARYTKAFQDVHYIENSKKADLLFDIHTNSYVYPLSVFGNVTDLKAFRVEEGIQLVVKREFHSQCKEISVYNQRDSKNDSLFKGENPSLKGQKVITYFRRDEDFYCFVVASNFNNDKKTLENPVIGYNYKVAKESQEQEKSNLRRNRSTNSFKFKEIVKVPENYVKIHKARNQVKGNNALFSDPEQYFQENFTLYVRTPTSILVLENQAWVPLLVLGQGEEIMFSKFDTKYFVTVSKLQEEQGQVTALKIFARDKSCKHLKKIIVDWDIKTNLKIIDDYIVFFSSDQLNIVKIRNGSQTIQYQFIGLEQYNFSRVYRFNDELTLGISDFGDTIYYMQLGEKPDNETFEGLCHYDYLISTELCNLVAKTNFTGDKIEFFMEESTVPFGFINSHYTQAQIQSFVELVGKDSNKLAAILSSEIPQELLINYPQFDSFLHYVNLKPKVLRAFATSLEIMKKQGIAIPLLIYNNRKGKNPIDLAREANNTICVELLLDIALSYQQPPTFEMILDQNINYIIKSRIDISKYMKLDSCFKKIDDDRLHHLSPHDDLLLKGIDQRSQDDIISFYKSQIVTSLGQAQRCGRQNIAQTQEKHPIEYFMVYLPRTMEDDLNPFIRQLNNSGEIQLFTFKAFQAIIDFKWNQYAKKFFYLRAAIFFAFLCFFLADIYYSSFSKVFDENNDLQEDKRDLASLIAIKAVACLFIVYFAYYEICSAVLQKGYFKDLWNLGDTLLIIGYPTITIIDACSIWYAGVTIIYVILIFIVFNKINFFLRINENFSYLVTMIWHSLNSVRYFLTFWLLFLAMFSVIFTILFQGEYIEGYNGLDIAGYFTSTIKLSLGDFEVEHYSEQKRYLVIFTWIIWMMAVIILNVIFMNFIIAVISSSYEEIMTNITAQSYKVKAQMIYESELHLFRGHKPSQPDPQNFPRYIFVRKPVDHQKDKQDDVQESIADLKNEVFETGQNLNARIVQIHDKMHSNFEAIMQQMRDMHLDMNGNAKRVKLIEQFIQKQLPQDKAKDDSANQGGVIDYVEPKTQKEVLKGDQSNIDEDGKANEDLRAVAQMILDQTK